MGLKLANNAVSSLTSAITTDATTLSLQSADAGKFPVLAAGDWHPATIVDQAGNMEIVYVTARNSAALTIERAKEGTTAKAFAAGSRIDVRLTAGSVGGMAAQSPNSVTITGGEITGITDLKVADGGTGASTASGARDNLGLGNVNNTSDADKPVSTAQQNALSSYAGGDRNKIINGNFDIWQRGTTFTPTGYSYSADMAAYSRDGTGTTVTISRQTFDIGQTDVPGNPEFFYRAAQTVAGSGATRHDLYGQPIEDVRTLAGKTATFTFYARCSSGTVPVRPRISQNFGTGGSPSAEVNTLGAVKTLTTTWQRFDQIFNIPSVSGKTLGTADNDALYVVLEFVNKNAVQTVDLARVSFVKDDATSDPDPHGDRSYQQTLLLCRRFFRFIPSIAMYPMNTISGSLGRRLEIPLEPPMRTAPTVTATPAAEVTSFNTSATPTLVRLTGNVGATDNWGVVDNVKIDASI